MGLIPLPSKLDKRERLRTHLNIFFKDFKLEPEGLIQEFDYFFSTSNKYNTMAEAKVELDKKINYIVTTIDEEAYVLNYPQFYLPITTDMPQIIISKSIDNFNGQYAPRGNWFNLNMNPTGGTWQWFGTLIHEYAHKATDSISEIDKTTNLLTSKLQEHLSIWNSFDELSTVPENEFAEAVSNNKFSKDYTTDTNRIGLRQDFDLNGYAQEMAKIDETLVRLKTNIGVSDHYHKLSDVFDTHPFTPLMVSIVEKFCWPDKKQLIMEKNK